MKLKAELNRHETDVEIRVNSERLSARVDDSHYELEVSRPEARVLLIRHNERVYEAITSDSKDGIFRVRIANDEFEVGITDPKRLGGSAGSQGHAGGLAQLKSAMPGKVVRIISDVGDEVQKGTTVIVVEAMKMQNEMKSPKDGFIREVRVATGATVEAGEVLIVIE